MKHLGDITKINGAEIEAVDCITGGSPCQDLSIAGKRKGLAGERSGLFMEQLRVIKEMRDATSGTDNIRPRYMVWENVPGAFSSNKGEDFRAVLEETARVVEKDTVIPRPPKDKWTNAGAIMGNGWSIAWRTMDAQFWGVPQRRRRIALVADFGGESAPEILFKPESVSGNFAESRAQRERTSGNVEGGFGETSKNITCLNDQGGGVMSVSTDVTATLRAAEHGHQPTIVQPTAYSFDSLSSNSMKSKNPHSGCREVEIAKCLDTTDPPVMAAFAQCSRQCKDATDLISHNMTVRRLTPLECSRLQGYPDNWTHIPGWKNPTKEEVEWWIEVHFTNDKITAKNPDKAKRKTEKYIRKWLKNPCSDSAEYKAYGNSIALPQWRYVLGNICDQLGRKATLGSLFDGISGFCLVWSEINGAENCRWSSEIEPYCIAVSKYHFGG